MPIYLANNVVTGDGYLMHVSCISDGRLRRLIGDRGADIDEEGQMV